MDFVWARSSHGTETQAEDQTQHTDQRHAPYGKGGGDGDDPLCKGAAEVEGVWKAPDALRLCHSWSLLGMLEEGQSESASGLAEDGRKQSREESG